MGREYTYFVHYGADTKDGKHGEGNMTTTIGHPIKNIEDIKKIELEIKLHFGLKSVVISNFILL